MKTPVTPRIFTAAETRELLPLPDLIQAVGRAFREQHTAAKRLVIPDDDQDWVVMPGLTADGGMLCKLLRVGDGLHGSTAVPTMSGAVLALDRNGQVRALLDGGALTAMRTAAVAGYATSLLADPDASVLAVFGAGRLAETHVAAIASVRPLSEIRVVGRSAARLHTFCARLESLGYAALPSDPRRALEGAEIVVTVTTAESPVFSDADVADGVHINAMGSYRPERAEVPAETVVRARVIVETRESAWLEAGDLIQPRDAGLIDERHVWAELREHERIATLRRLEPDAVTLFKSVGHVALDLVALEVALDQFAARQRA